MTTQVNRLAVSISAHAWNKDCTKLAISPNNNKIIIFAKQGNEWVKEAVLKEHDAIVTSLDWAPNTNRILSCSQDRNAYVWTLTNGQWKPTLVILRLNRAATHAAWSPNEDKFAIASSQAVVSVCYFDETNDWWVSKHIKKFDSTVLSVSWHPNNVLLAAASSDNHCRVFSAFVKGVDTKESVANGTAFGNKLPFGSVLKEIPVSGWVHCVKWSPSGNRLAFASHDSTLHVLECASSDHQLNSTSYPRLPFIDILFINENSIVGVGHDYNPLLFQFENTWQYKGKLDVGGAGAAKKASSNIAKWQSMDKKGVAESETTIDTNHLNCITCIKAVSKAGDAVKQFSTSGLDGIVCTWDVATLEKNTGFKF